MVTQDSNQMPSLADLLESAVAAAHPDRLSGRLSDYSDYRMPLDRLTGHAADGEVSGSIKWSAALKAAYQDGYDPILWVGRGAFSEVWRCVDRSFGREVAIKVPFHKLGKDSDAVVAALQSEAELLGRLHHPGIVHAVRRSGEGRNAYLVLDFVDGEDLIEHSRLLKLDGRVRLQLFAKVLDAVSHLHSKGIVHGDLKPDHILVRENDQPVLIDFGLSSSDSSSSLRLSGGRRLGGSGRFRAPEIADGSAVSTAPQQDVYSLGVILRELLDDLSEDRIDSALQRIIDRCVQDDPDERWQDAGAMLEALRSVLEPNRINEADVVTAASSKPEPRAHKVFYGALSLGAVVAILLVGLFLVTEKPEVGERDEHGLGDASHSRAVAQASIFDIALQDIYSADYELASERLSQIAEQSPDGSSAWEHRHLHAMSKGRGEVYPLDRLPYGATSALCVDYDPASETVAYVIRGQGKYELWVRPVNGHARLFANSVEAVRAIALSPGSDRVAAIDINGRVVVWTLQDGGAEVLVSQEIPRLADDRIVWFSADGSSLLIFSPRHRAIESWSVENPVPANPSFVISDCDHAYRLPSGEGAFMVATAGDRTANGQTQLRLINSVGEVTRQLELDDEQVPVSADSGPGLGATVCLGMANGYVRIHRANNGGWMNPCDLGLNQAIPAVVYSELEQRVYAALGRVHVIAADGQLVMRLGDRDAPQQLVTRLDFDNTTATLSCVSIREFWRCVAD